MFCGAIEGALERCGECVERRRVRTWPAFWRHQTLAKLSHHFLERLDMSGDIGRVDAFERQVPEVALHAIVVAADAVLFEERRGRSRRGGVAPSLLRRA